MLSQRLDEFAVKDRDELGSKAMVGVSMEVSRLTKIMFDYCDRAHRCKSE
uniref:Uncharacterized protein n=1 Tax=Arion vulgaris TaxID=1028688 RepID=A0A0B7BYA5_9EUPU